MSEAVKSLPRFIACLTAPKHSSLINKISYPLLKPQLPTGSQKLTWSSLYGAALGIAVSEALAKHDGVIVIVLEEQRQLQILESEIKYFLRNDEYIPVHSFPSWECLPYDQFSPHQDIISQRLQLLSKLSSMQKGVLLIQTSNLMQKLPPVDYVLGHTFSLNVGQDIDLDSLRLQLTNANYYSVNQVMSHGEYAVRGGLIDIFPMGALAPFRLDLFDKEIESIRLFDPDTQRSNENIESIELLPAKEFPMTVEGINSSDQHSGDTSKETPRKQTIYNEVSAGNVPPGTEFFFPLFFHRTSSVFEYIKSNPLFLTTADFEDNVSTYWAEINDRYTNANYDPNRKVLDPDQLYHHPDNLKTSINGFSRIILSNTKSGLTDWSSSSCRNRQFPVNSRDESPYKELLAHLSNSKNRILFVAETPGRRESLEGILSNSDIAVNSIDQIHEFLWDDTISIATTVGPLERGFTSHDLGIEIIVKVSCTEKKFSSGDAETRNL